MNIKSLLLGSAAALAAVSGAQAADAIVAASPEPMEYVRVCDAFGTGYFYIPGTETCLKIGGYVRFEVQWNDQDDAKNWNARTRGLVSFQTKTDTEYGALGSTITMRTWAESDYNGGSVELDEALITLGGFKVGYGYNYWDSDLSGETDDLGSNRVNMIGYEYTGSAFTAGAFIDELSKRYSEPTSAGYTGNNDSVGVEGQISGAFGPVSASLLGSYDFHVNEGSIRAMATADVGPGTLGLAGIWSSGGNAYYDLGEWTIAAQYAAKLTDKFTITPGFQYWDNTVAFANGDFGGPDAWRAGVTLDYKIVEGLTSKVSVQYTDTKNDDWAYADGWSGFVRLQRTF
jgi:opacity protein-like surface antigen